MITTILTAVYPTLGIVIVGILGYLGKKLLGVLPHVVAFFVAKTGLINYDKLKKDAIDIWNILEENDRIGELADTKIVSFANMLKAKYPEITDEKINELNKAIAGEFNKDKPFIVKELSPVEETPIVAQVKYVDGQGNELVQKVVPVAV